jgi:large-conductance mechanosensitive channel
VINYLLVLVLGEDSLSEVFTFLKRVDLEDGTPDLTQSIYKVYYSVDERSPIYVDTLRKVGTPDLTQSIYIDWGTFINAIINFVLIAVTLFVILRVITGITKKLERAMNEEKLALEAAEKAKKEAEEKAKAEKEAELKKALKEREDQFYLNVEKQTEALNKICEYLNQNKN